MIKNCDLHCHSVHSDGTKTVKELIQMAKDLNIVLALTDHNTTSGLAEAEEEAKKMGVTFVPGAEITCEHQGIEFHLLGLFIEPQHYKKIEFLAKEMHFLKEINNIELIERLNEAGYMINYANVKKRNINGNANRAHVAAELVDKGYVSSIAEAFKTLLSEDGGFYKQGDRLQMYDVIDLFYEINVLPILAHPLKEVSIEHLDQMLPELIEYGLLGIETMHSDYNDKMIEASKKIAQKYNLLESGGSDYHGSVKPTIQLKVGKGNLDIPYSIYEKLVTFRKEFYHLEN